MFKIECISATRSNLGEGPLWHNGRIHWIDIHGKRIHNHDLRTGDEKIIRLDKVVGAVVARKGGGLVAALKDGIYAIDETTQVVTPIASPADQPADTRFNDGKVDPAGRLWAGTMGPKESGTLYMLDADHQLHPRVPGVTISNGLAWTRDRKTMYYTDTPTHKISAFDYDDTRGTIANRRTVIEIDPAEGHPDGMTIDEHDNLWIGLWGGHAVVCIDPRTGERLRKIEFPAANCSSCCFGGENLDELFVTTARAGVSEADLAREPLTGGVFRVKVDVKGLPANEYVG